jgi:hypothetical protein
MVSRFPGPYSSSVPPRFKKLQLEIFAAVFVELCKDTKMRSDVACLGTYRGYWRSRRHSAPRKEKEGSVRLRDASLVEWRKSSEDGNMLEFL